MIFGPCGYAWADDRTRMEGASPHHVCAETGDHDIHRCACGVIFGPDTVDFGYDCDVADCPNPAVWAYIGESGDLYLCDDHHQDAPNWHRIPA